jgi:hypothetical protein
VAARSLRRFGIAVCAALTATALTVPAASAKSAGLGGLLGGILAPTCNSTGTQVVSGNQPFFGSGQHSLSLPSGSTATSPATCIGAGDLYVRMFGADKGGVDSGLRVRVVWYGLLNKVLGITDFNTYAPGSDWSPTDKLSSSGGSIAVPLLPILGSTSARVEITPIGSGSHWVIDDLYIDPMSLRG